MANQIQRWGMWVTGTEAGDFLFGSIGDDTLMGHGGNDTLQGLMGADTYVFSRGDGRDRISDHASYFSTDENGQPLRDTDRIQFTDINPEDIDYVRLDSMAFYPHLLIGYGGQGDEITVEGGGDGPDSFMGIQEIYFADGTVWDLAAIAARFVREQQGSPEADTLHGSYLDDTLLGLAGNDVLLGGDGHDELDGGDGDDDLQGGDGDDTLVAGAGNDTLTGGFGSDVYVVSRGDGEVLIKDRGFAGDSNRLVFMDINPSDLVSFSVAVGEGWFGELDLVIAYGDQGDRIVLSQAGSERSAGVQELHFADGTVWDRDQIEAQLNLVQNGTPEDDELNGTYLGDTLMGGEGNDTLQGNDGDDHLLGQGGNDLIWAGEGNDTLLGGDGADDLDGDDGDDLLMGEAGADRLDGGFGHDTLVGGWGTDTLVGSFGDDVFRLSLGDGVSWIEDAAHGRWESEDDQDTPIWVVDANRIEFLDVNPSDVQSVGLEFQEGNELDWANLVMVYGTFGDRVVFQEAGSNKSHGVDEIRFADGTVWDRSVLESWLVRHQPGTSGDDRWVGSYLSDTLEGGGGNDELRAYEGDDLLLGQEGHDLLHGGYGDDTLIGGVGADTLTGGGGSDVYRLSRGDGADRIIEYWPGDWNRLEFTDIGLDEVRYVRTEGNFWAEGMHWVIGYGDEGDQVTLWRAASDPLSRLQEIRFADGQSWSAQDLEARAGVVLKAAPYGDTLSGGLGSDTLVGNWGSDHLNGGAGQDWLHFVDVWNGVNVRLWSQLVLDDGVGWVDTVIGFENVLGTPLADHIAGDAQANILVGLADHDTLRGGSGNDTLQGGHGDDHLHGGLGFDAADYATAASGISVKLWKQRAEQDGDGGADTLVSIEHVVGSSFDDFIAGDESANRLHGGVGNDTLRGGSDDDTLLGGSGHDALHGGAGFDTADYRYASSGVVIKLWKQRAENDGDAGSDTLVSIEHVVGSAFDDFIAGDQHANLLEGGAGHDTLRGGSGEDTLVGAAGNDLLVLGSGANTVVVGRADGQDRVEGFSSLQGDRIQLESGLQGIVTAADALAAASASGTDVYLDLGQGHGLTLVGVRLEDLDPSAFVIV